MSAVLGLSRLLEHARTLPAALSSPKFPCKLSLSHMCYHTIRLLLVSALLLHCQLNSSFAFMTASASVGNIRKMSRKASDTLGTRATPTSLQGTCASSKPSSALFRKLPYACPAIPLLLPSTDTDFVKAATPWQDLGTA